MAQVLRRLTPATSDELLIGAEAGDDGAVWRLDGDRVLVVTADFITPVVDDPRSWGRIAAVNAVSDVYAMGGRPLLALNLVGWPREQLGLDVLDAVLAGAAEAAREGGWVVAGGHTVDDPHPKFGLAVVGQARPDRLLRNTGLRDGDALVLSKPLGTGIVSTAIKQERAGEQVVAAAVASMTRTNESAMRIALAAGATGATDVTGFGLLGHARKLAEASGVDVDLDAGAVPLLPGVRELAAEGVVPGGTRRNLEWARERLDPGAVGEDVQLLLADAQTSGGLLFGVAPQAAAAAVARLRGEGHDAAAVGSARAGAGRTRLHG